MREIAYYYSIGSTVFIVLLIIILMTFMKSTKKQKKKVKEAQYELEELKENSLSTEQNNILSEILKVSLRKDELSKSCMSIVRVLLKSFKIDFCTILLPNDRGQYKVIATNIRNQEEVKELEDFTNAELLSNTEPIVYWCKDSPLEYKFSRKRGIKYFFLIPLEIEKDTIGALVIEKYSITDKEAFEEDFFKIVIDNITVAIERFKDKDKMAAMAMKDGLTNVYNRNYMDRLLSVETERHLQRGSSFSLILFDIDHFKNFNDTYGHLFGDKVLQSLATYFKTNIRTDDVIFRSGGEEFVLFLPDSHSNQVFNRVDSLREGLSQMPVSMEVEGEMKTVYVTASFGIAEYPKDSKSIKGVLERADKAAYHSKRSGRNRVTIYTEDIVMIKED